MPIRRSALCLVPVLLLATACGSSAVTSQGDGPPATNAPAYEPSADAVIVRISEGGGFVPYEYGFQQQTARVEVLGDGRMLVTGAPGMESWLSATEHRLDDEAMSSLLADADDAGLLAPAPDYGMPGVTDMGTTTVDISVDAGTFKHAAYGLGVDEGLTAPQKTARKHLREFVALALAPRQAPGREYVADRIAVLVTPSSVEGSGRRWTGPALSAECTMLAGDDAAAAVALLRTARIDQDWRVAGETVHVVARPLLPGDAGCP
jgi:hypothetical protein